MTKKKAPVAAASRYLMCCLKSSETKCRAVKARQRERILARGKCRTEKMEIMPNGEQRDVLSYFNVKCSRGVYQSQTFFSIGGGANRLLQKEAALRLQRCR